MIILFIDLLILYYPICMYLNISYMYVRYIHPFG